MLVVGGVQQGEEASRPAQRGIDVEQVEQRDAAGFQHVVVRLHQAETDRQHGQALEQVDHRDDAQLAASALQVEGVLEALVGFADRMRMVLHRPVPFAANQR
jgi:hypothetical protein